MCKNFWQLSFAEGGWNWDLEIWNEGFVAIENVMYRTLLAICGSAEMLLKDGRPYKIACDVFPAIVPRFLFYMKERRDT